MGKPEKFCGICRSKEHWTAEHYKISGSSSGRTEGFEPSKGGSSPPPETINQEGLIDPPRLKRGRKRIYKDAAAKSRAYYRRKNGLPIIPEDKG